MEVYKFSNIHTLSEKHTYNKLTLKGKLLKEFDALFGTYITNTLTCEFDYSNF